VAGGAIFGSIMWVLVVALSDKAEGKPDGPAEHWYSCLRVGHDAFKYVN